MKLNNNDDSHNSGLNLLIYNMLLDIESHPAWVCGLKLVTNGISPPYSCHTLRGCVDWNCLGVSVETDVCEVTPCVGVWIETRPGRCWWSRTPGHTLRGCVDWNLLCFVRFCIVMSHPAWVCGLKHISFGERNRRQGHTLRGCVDWNTHTGTAPVPPQESHPAWVCGLKLRITGTNKWTIGHTLRGCVDWNSNSPTPCP